jgi:hypothetical protein
MKRRLLPAWLVMERKFWLETAMRMVWSLEC